MIRRWMWLAAAGVVMLVAGFTLARAAPPAQAAEPIRYGDTLFRGITEAEPCAWFWFEGGQGDPVTIDMQRTAGNLDGVLFLYQGEYDGREPEGLPDPIAANDDRPSGGLDPLIGVRLPATDRYTIAACRVEYERLRPTTGTFNLTLTGPDDADSAVPPTATPPPLSGGLFDAPNDAPPAALTPTPTGAPSGAAPVATAATIPFPAASLEAGPPPSATPFAGLVIPTITPAPTGFVFVVPTLPPLPTAAGLTLANACQYGPGPTSSDRLAEVYMAAGDGYTAEELTQTNNFLPDDDLNLLARRSEAEPPVTIAVRFCAPDGGVYDAGETEIADRDLYLFGVDWEYERIPWPEGRWYVEIYLDGTLELKFSFEVRAE